MAYIVKNATNAVHSISVALDSENSKLIVLKPGNNEMEENVWESLSKHPKVQERINTGKYIMIAPDLVSEEDKKIEEENGASESLSGYSVSKAKDLVKGTYDLELLEKWETEESRSKVKAQIKSQIKKVKED